MIPDKVCILCIYCKRQTVTMFSTTDEINCACGRPVKNPYYKEIKVDNINIRPEEK